MSLLFHFATLSSVWPNILHTDLIEGTGDNNMKRLKKALTKIIPEYSFIPLALALSFNFLVYYGARLVAGNWHHYNITTPLDRRIPFWSPSAFIYLGCYLFWCINYILIARQSKKEVCQFFSADLLSRLICLVCFLAFPTATVRPYVEPDGFWNQVILLLYSIDAADNLFPSIHCLVSWFCYIGIKRKKEIPVWYQRISCIIAILVCISTLTTKQHVLIDVIGGILLAEISFRIGKHTPIAQTYERFLDKIQRFIP